MLSIIRSSGVRLIAEIRAGISTTGSLYARKEDSKRRVRKAKEAQPPGKICYLRPREEREREREAGTISRRTALLQRPVNSPRAPTSPPSASSSSFFPPFTSFSCSSSSSFYLEAREARTTCLLEKSAPLPRALINLHSAKSEERRGKGGIGFLCGFLPVLLRLMLPIKCRAVNLINSRNARRGAN